MIKMNQDFNNLNQNNLNIQGNNGIPNNQTLNNTYGQMPINQPNVQTNNSFNQPQQPMQQPVQNNASVNIQPSNNKPKKKLGLIIGIVVAVIVIILGIALSSKIFKNGANNNNSKKNSSVTSKNDYSMEKLKEQAEDIYITNFVDSQLGYYFKYPVIIHPEDHDDGGFRDYNVFVQRLDNYDNITSALGVNSIKIMKLSQIEGYQSSLSFNELSEKIKKDYYVSSTKFTLIEEFTNNEINWAKYKIEQENNSFELLYVAKKGQNLLAISFNTNSEINSLNEDFNNKIKQNIESICDSIISSLEFIQDKETLMNMKEASILYYDNLHEINPLTIYDSNGNSTIESYSICKISAEGIGYKKTSDININNAINKLTTANFQHAALDIDENIKYNIKEEGNVIVLKEKNVGEIKIKYYELEKANLEYSKLNSAIIAYVFETNDYYGIILDDSNTYKSKTNLDYVVKNISFKENQLSPWDVEDFIK